MRTTLTLDKDNAVRLERMRKLRDAKLKDVVNDALRRGLDQMEIAPKRREPYRTRVVDLGAPLFTDLKELIAELDEEYDRKKLG